MFYAHGWGATPFQAKTIAEAMRQRGIILNFFGLDLTKTVIRERFLLTLVVIVPLSNRTRSTRKV